MTTEDYVALVIEVPKAHAVYLAEPNEENFLRWYEGSKALSIVRAERVASKAPMVDDSDLGESPTQTRTNLLGF